MNDQPPRFFDDVSRPGGTPAHPNSRPVIDNGPPQSDPMMTGGQALAMAPSQASAMTGGQALAMAPSQASASVSSSATAMPEASTTLSSSSFDPNHTTLPSTTAIASTKSQPEPVHALQSNDAFYGQVGKRPRGKKWLVGLLALVLIGAIGYGGWMYWQNQKKIADNTGSPATNNAAQPIAANVKDPKTYTNTKAGFELSNTYDWPVTETDTADKYVRVDFAISDSQKLSFDFNAGSPIVDCTPKSTDVAFKPGNKCSSYKAVSLDELTATNFPADKLSSTIKEVYLVKFLYMAALDDKQYSLIGITPATEDKQGIKTVPELDVAKRGFYLPFTSLALKDGNIDIKLTDNDGKPTQLSEDNLIKVEAVLKSFKLTD